MEQTTADEIMDYEGSAMAISLLVDASAGSLALASGLSTSKSRPCSGCRLRRIRCIRDPGSEGIECNGCRLKGIKCVPMPPPAKRRVANRGGPVIAAARAKFGAAESSKSSSSPSPPASAMVPRASALQPTSASERINNSELRSVLIADLLDFYLDFIKIAPTFYDETKLRTKFDAAGRQTHQLDDQSQVLLAAMAAVAARTPDHPLIIGSCPYRIGGLGQAVFQGIDLSEFGRRREGACVILTEHAVALVDVKRTLRVASPESVTALLLLEGLKQTWEFKSPQLPWVTSYLGHARGLLDELRNNAGIAWTALMRDVIISSRAGRTATFSEDDLDRLWGGNPPPPISDLVLHSVPYDSETGFIVLFDIWLNAMALLAIRTPARLTGVRARRAASIDEDFVLESITTLDHTGSVLPELTRRAEAMQQQPEFGGRYIINNYRTLRLCWCMSVLLVHDVVNGRAADFLAQAALQEMLDDNSGPMVLDQDYGSRLLALLAQTHARGMRAAREISHILKEVVSSEAIGNSWTDPKIIEVIFVEAKNWITLLIEYPSAEEGGPDPVYTWDVKITELSWILKSLWSVSWSYERVGQTVPWLQREIASQRERRDEFRRNIHLTDLPPKLSDEL